MKFAPVHTLADLNSLNEADIIEGYRSAERGDPEPGENRGRAFWHGWRCRMMDYRELKSDEGHRRLIGEYLAEQRRLTALALEAEANKKKGRWK